METIRRQKAPSTKEKSSNVFLQPGPHFIVVAGHHQLEPVRFEEKKNNPDAA